MFNQICERKFIVPNDCENNLELTHVDKSKLEEALAAFKRGELLSYFMPEPAYENANEWSSGRDDNWGTRWDACGVESDDETKIEGNPYSSISCRQGYRHYARTML